MNPALHHALMQARHHDLVQSAARQRLAAQDKAARRAARDDAATARRPGVWRLAWRLLPA